ncbi:MAG: hypothetical protein ACI89J_004125 [Hyphomicrobiaceae bacterium]|jgi:hypothetical protein
MADTAVSIGCRKTIEVAGRLSAWLDRSDVLAAEVKPVIGTALERATLDLRRVMRSIDFPPCVGVVGGPDRNKLQLVASALFQEGSTTVSELSDLRNQQQGLAALLDHIAGEDLGAAVRFRSADARAPVGEGYRFPVQIELLSSLDVVKIIIAAYYSHYPDAVRTKLNQSDIESAIERADSELSTAAVSGFSPEDVSSLRQHLWTEFPRIDGLRTLSTSGYWDWLGKHVAHLSVDGRCEILAYLWHFEPNLTALFKRLTEALRDFGYASSIRVPVEAVLGVDPQTGGHGSHLACVIRQATVSGLLRDDEPAMDLSVSVGQGIVRSANRATIAALSAAITLRVNRSAPFPLESTDLKIFPSPAPLTDWSLNLADGAIGDHQLGKEFTAQLYARCKSVYVFSRSCTSNELAAVVMLADAGEVPDDMHMRAIGDWIELSEGADPRARERMENCLAILVKSSDAAPASGQNGGTNGAGFSDTFDRNRFVADLLGENNRWAQEWTPGRPFSQIHFVPEFTSAAAAPPVRQNGLSAAANDGVFPVRVPTPTPTTIATGLLLDIAANSSQIIRVRQIRRQLATIQRAMQARMFRYHRSSNPAQFTDWRRQIANVATKRLEVCAEERQLGNMLGILTLSEAEVRMLLAGLKGDTVEYQEIDEYSIDINMSRSALPEPEICAEATVATWLKLMHEAASSRHLCSQLNIAQPVFQHIIDEIVIGVHRADLVGTLTKKFLRTLESGNPLSDLPRCYAVVASRTLGSFLERLADTKSVGNASMSADAKQLGRGSHPRQTAGAHRDRTHSETSGGPRSRADPGRRRFSHWPALFRHMVDDNIVAAEGLTVHSESDHELGEYLSMLTSNPLEVEL